jgi:hypothetical protein
MSPAKLLPVAALLLLFSCNATDSVNHYENADSIVPGARIDHKHLNAPRDTSGDKPKKKRDSTSLRVPPPGETDTTKLNIQE